jgi:hypothetical protein
MRRALLVVLTLLLAACGQRACGGLGGLPPAGMPLVHRADGDYRMLDRGAWKGYYNGKGQLVIAEYDSSGDGRADYIAHYDENKQIRLIEVDEDHDSWVDRFEYYDAPDGRPARIEYDDDGDGKPERAEVMKDGELVRVEIDSDHDGRIDRWQNWEHGRLVSEEIDSNGDGKPDRRLVFGPHARLLRIEPIAR